MTRKPGLAARRLIAKLIVVTGLFNVCSPALGDIIYETDNPFGGAFGVLGFDVYDHQSVAVRFTPDDNYTLDRISLWLWNNSFTGIEPSITVSLRNDDTSGGSSVPGEEIFATWQFVVPDTDGFNPQLFPLGSKNHPALAAGVNYWVVAESEAIGQHDPVWAIAFPTQGMYSLTDFVTGEWSPASFGPAPATIVEGSLDGGSGEVGDLNGDGIVGAADLAMLLASWGPCPKKGDCPADLNGDGVVGAADLAMLLANWS